MKNRVKGIAVKYRDRLLTSLNSRMESLEAGINQNSAELEKLNSAVVGLHATSCDDVRLMPISEKLLITKMFSGLKICLDPSDVAVVPHLALDGIWERNVTAAWQNVLKPGQTVLDIGANFGYFGLLAAQRYPEAVLQKVIFFEANPNLTPYINRTLSINGLHRLCAVENVGVADKNGKATLTLLKDFIGSSSLHSSEHLDSYLGEKMPIEVQQKIEVKTVSIDSYCKAHNIGAVQLMKLDIEGFEDKAYEGMKAIVKASLELVIFLEFTQRSYAEPKAFYKKLHEDFKYMYLISDDGELSLPGDTAYETIIGEVNDFIMLVFSKVPLENKG